MRKQPVIRAGDPQPFDCPRCEAKMGYQVSDKMTVNFNTIWDGKTGAFERAFYSDSQRVLNEGISPYCPNCGIKLRFKVKRHAEERLEK